MLGNWWALALVALGLRSLERVPPRFAFEEARAGGSLLLALAVAVYGSLVFHADQVRGPRFLAQRGVSARLVWLSRQIVSIAVLAAITMAVAGLEMAWQVWSHPLSTLLEFGTADLATANWAYPASSLATFMLAVYAAGQVASLFVRRSLLAGVAAAALGLCITSWAYLMLVLGIAWWWTVLPLVAGCFAATWLRAPDWMLERTGWRGWIAPAAALALPTALVFVAVACFRVYQIPDPSPMPIYFPRGASVPDPAALPKRIDWADVWNKALPIKSTDPIDVVARAKAKRELYDQASVLLGQIAAPTATTQATRDQAEGNDKTNDSDKTEGRDKTEGNGNLDAQENRPAFVDPLMAASRLDGPFWAKNWSDGRAFAAQVGQAVRRLAYFADDETKQGNLDQALDMYFAVMRADIDAARWGGLRPGGRQFNWPEFPAFRSLMQWADAPGQTVDRIEQAIRRLQEFHAGLPPPESLVDAIFEEAPQRVFAEGFDAVAVLRYMPWERARTRRLVDLLTFDEIEKLQDIDSCLKRGTPVGEIKLGTVVRHRNPQENGTPRAVPVHGDWPYPGPIRMAKMLKTTPFISDSGIAAAEPITAVLQFETDYRATLIILAVEAWKLEHGHLPAHLDEVLGGELKELPVEPIRGEPFGYFPDGLPDNPRWSPGAPPVARVFLWSSSHPSGEKTEHRWPLTGNSENWQGYFLGQ